MFFVSFLQQAGESGSDVNGWKGYSGNDYGCRVNITKSSRAVMTG
jgi:hypothetical protein